MKPVINKKPKWAVIDKNGKIIEKFRYKLTAIRYLPKLRKISVVGGLMIISLDNYKKESSAALK